MWKGAHLACQALSEAMARAERSAARALGAGKGAGSMPQRLARYHSERASKNSRLKRLQRVVRYSIIWKRIHRVLLHRAKLLSASSSTNRLPVAIRSSVALSPPPLPPAAARCLNSALRRSLVLGSKSSCSVPDHGHRVGDVRSSTNRGKSSILKSLITESRTVMKEEVSLLSPTLVGILFPSSKLDLDLNERR